MSQVTKLLRQRAEPRRPAVVLPQLSDERESYAGRFAYPARREVRRLMRSSPRLADLAVVFPGAMYALATRRGTQEARDAAIALIEGGAALKTVARALELPLWLRRLPPEAFQKVIAPVPSSESFTRRVATRLPAAPSAQCAVARQRRLRHQGLPRGLRPVARRSSDLQRARQARADVRRARRLCLAFTRHADARP